MQKKNENFKKNNVQLVLNKINSDDNINNANDNSVIKKELKNTDLSDKIIDNLSLYHSSIISTPVSITIELGKKKITIKELLQLSQDSIIELEDKVDEPLNIYVNNHLIALGELVVHNEKYGVRIIKLL
ncbi:Flagellar motor switch protein FliN [Buchnera aphidicola (Cinara piceae)]|uniref:Flagellar motor switch protein FliN n=1 Tax=Buchnera aphidicola (Cinara piceae) TaxID=1660043 RepID=A0A803FTC9_9GAMM|nr:flagellar motor switch protein FliN [Buchnera aphidicola]VFP87883.1 Flagellar motor switch protein FliN [Buchnera aphidicola (Cinara piceae)]